MARVSVKQGVMDIRENETTCWNGMGKKVVRSAEGRFHPTDDQANKRKLLRTNATYITDRLRLRMVSLGVSPNLVP